MEEGKKVALKRGEMEEKRLDKRTMGMMWEDQ